MKIVLASGVLALREKLGPFLWQFPPNFHLDLPRFEQFFRALPRSTSEAAAMAKKHDDWMKGRVLTSTDLDRPLRHCIEIRHPSFMIPEFFKLLREQKIAFVFADTAGLWPYAEDVTSDFIYARLHGAEELYASGYTDPALEWWADRIRKWAHGKQPADAKLVGPKPKRRMIVEDVFVYFDNDVKVRAPFDARSLAEKLGVGLPVPAFERTASARKSKHVEEEPRAAAPAIRKRKRRSSEKSPSRRKSGGKRSVNSQRSRAKASA